ncbi:MAG TPA: hypothetical protein VN132_14715 [Bdellovibrio sp.]|nr:hypothetical protein [Bdellovibrio sp.]
MKLGIVLFAILTSTSAAFAGPRCQFITSFGNMSDYYKQHPEALISIPMTTNKEWGDAERKLGELTWVGSKDLGDMGKLYVGYNVSTAPKEKRTIDISIQNGAPIYLSVTGQAYPDQNGVVDFSYSDTARNDLRVHVKCKGLELNNPLPEVDYNSDEFTKGDIMYMIKD